MFLEREKEDDAIWRRAERKRERERERDAAAGWMIVSKRERVCVYVSVSFRRLSRLSFLSFDGAEGERERERENRQ